MDFKFFFMIPCAAILLYGCKSEEIDYRQTDTVNGLLYKLYDDEPFTGKVSNYPLITAYCNVGGVLKCDVGFEKGLKQGAVDCYAGDDKAYNAEYDQGKRNGLEVHYYKGRKIEEGNYINNAISGLYKLYSKDTGVLIDEYDYVTPANY